MSNFSVNTAPFVSFLTSHYYAVVGQEVQIRIEVIDIDNDTVTLYFEGPENLNITMLKEFNFTYTWVPKSTDPVNVR